MKTMGNEDVARIFDEVADLLEIEDASPFRVRAYRTAAGTLRGLGREAREMLARDEKLTDLPGIGKDLAGKIEEIIRRGHLRILDDLHAEIPASLELLLRIPGLGPKRVKALYTHLGIEDLDALRRAAQAGEIRRLPGFGEKTEQRILQSVMAQREKKTRIQRDAAAPQARALVKFMRDLPNVREAVVAGSYRRGRISVGDLDLLVAADESSRVLERFAAYPAILQQTAQGPTRASALLDDGMQVDLRVVAPESFGAALHYFTGSKAHNIQVRRLGQQHGLKINEYGVFQGAERIAGTTEESVFASVGLPFIPPELREDHGEIEAGLEGRLPVLIERSDLRGDLHSHTLYSDGNADLHAMALAAQKQGLEYLAITDHSHRLSPAHGPDESKLRAQMDAVDRLNGELKGITLLKGIEVDILADGRLDLPDNVLAKLDLVVASVHTDVQLSRRRQTERLLRALDHRYLSILGHPGGRFYPEREGYAVDLDRVIRRAQERHCFVELNSQPKRLDLSDIYCRVAREAGVLVSIASDSHHPKDFDHLELGITQGRRGWLRREDVLNTRSLLDVKKLLRSTFL
jgi:DNA polymerase (family 10)